jgi:hypothetical protein
MSISFSFLKEPPIPVLTFQKVMVGSWGAMYLSSTLQVFNLWLQFRQFFQI